MPVTTGIIGLAEKKFCGSDGKSNCHHFPPLVYKNPSTSIVPEKGQMSPSHSSGEDSLSRSFVRPAATKFLASTTL
jgi:hypothetical protein